MSVLTASPLGGYNYTHIAAGQATTVVKSGTGFLHSIVFNGPATSTNVTTVYDNTAASGTVIGILNPTTTNPQVTVIYDIGFATGLTISTTVANGSDMTVIWK